MTAPVDDADIERDTFDGLLRDLAARARDACKPTAVPASDAAASETSSEASRAGPAAPSTLDSEADDATDAGSREVSASGVSALVNRLCAASREQDALELLDELRGSSKLGTVEADVLRGEVCLAQGRVSEASACFLAVLSEAPGEESALCALGRLHQRNNDLDGAYQVAEQLLTQGPRLPDSRQLCAEVLLDVGTARKAAGDSHRALALYGRILDVLPESSQALYHIGVLAYERGSKGDAKALYRRAVAADPGNVQAWTNLGVLEREGGDLEAAQAALAAALAHAPTHPVVLANLASLHVLIGNRANPENPANCGAPAGPAAARAAYERALAYDPASTDALYNLGVLAAADRSWERALFYYRTCVRLAPKNSLAWNNLGVAYQNVDNVAAAMECYEAAVAARPAFALALNNLGVLLTTQGHSARGRRHLRAAIAADATYAEAHNNLGVLLRDMGLVREAIEAYERCTRLAPSSVNAAQNRLLALNYIHPGESALVCRAHADWGAATEAAAAPLPPLAPAEWRAAPDGRLRVGYVSPDLHRHSVSYFAEAPLLRHNRDAVEVFVYDATPKQDAKSAYLRADTEAAGCTWRRVVGLSDGDTAARIREDGVDVLVELTGHTANNRLGVMACRPAPVQMTWIGYPNSTGLSSVDYRITDAISDPEDTAQTYVEELLRLPGCFLCYTPMRDPPPVAAAPCVTNGFVTFGSFNALAKITDDVIETWCSILSAVPGSRLVLKNKPFACADTRAMWLRRFTSRGVAGWRIDLLPLTADTGDHLQQYSLMDISLDPWPYAGTTTTCESLFMGVPCLSLEGACHAHNVGKTLLATVRMTDGWLARSRREYVALAAQHAADPGGLARLRARLRGEVLASPLCDAPPFIAALEARYRECCERWRAGRRASESGGGGSGGSSASGEVAWQTDDGVRAEAAAAQPED